jgi:hypothetical protein
LEPNSARLPTREKIGYGLGDAASNIFFQTVNLFLLLYYIDVFGLSPAVAVPSSKRRRTARDAAKEATVPTCRGWRCPSASSLGLPLRRRRSNFPSSYPDTSI